MLHFRSAVEPAASQTWLIGIAVGHDYYQLVAPPSLDPAGYDDLVKDAEAPCIPIFSQDFLDYHGYHLKCSDSEGSPVSDLPGTSPDLRCSLLKPQQAAIGMRVPTPQASPFS